MRDFETPGSQIRGVLAGNNYMDSKGQTYTVSAADLYSNVISVTYKSGETEQKRISDILGDILVLNEAHEETLRKEILSFQIRSANLKFTGGEKTLDGDISRASDA